MHVISRRALREFWQRHPDAGQSLRAWFQEAEAAAWASSAELKGRYPSASIVTADRVVFNIGGNKYRLVVRINYASATLFIRFVGTHAEYDAIKVETV
jgi:mRNA interferase HigB